MMKNKTLIKYNDEIFRILDIRETRAFVINCNKNLCRDGSILIPYLVFFCVLMMIFALLKI